MWGKLSVVTLIMVNYNSNRKRKRLYKKNHVMKKKHIELLNYLLNHINATSKEIAAALSISTRSVKNYVNEINLLNKEKVILSSKQGYTIQKTLARNLLSSHDEELPQTSEQRGFYIIKQIMLEHSSHVDIFDLCDSLYVSYSTIKSDIAKMNKTFANFHIHFTCENDVVRLHGSEKNKRKLVSYVMYEETDQQFMDAGIIKESFSDVSIDKVSNIIRNTFQKYNYYINDFSFVNLLLHFAIIIDRMQEGNLLESQNEDFYIESEIERSLVLELCQQLEDVFHIKFNKNEQFEIYMLFKTNANYSMPSSEENLRKLVGNEILQLTKDIVQKVNESYLIDLNHESFVTPFSLHLKNLLLRAKNETYTKNPMVDAIKSSCPTVYDIAIFISLELMHRYQIEINEDEVTFLALHIGAEIEREKTNDSKIKCILLCPDYMNMTSIIYNKLLIDFGNQINIIKTISYEHELEKLHYDILITTVPLKNQNEHEICTIPPFNFESSFSHLQQCIENFKINQKNFILKKNFNDFFSEELFLANPLENEKNAVLHRLCERMVELEYVTSDFEENVLVREKAASTAFVNIAIPHAMEMEALKTCIGVVISKQGIRWDQQCIHLVLLVAINKVDKRIFHDLYEALVILFSNDKVMELVSKCTSFSDFEKLIYSSISYHEE